MINEVKKIGYSYTCSCGRKATVYHTDKEAQQICRLFEPKGDGIKNMEEFYQKYLLEYSGKYPIKMVLSK